MDDDGLTNAELLSTTDAQVWAKEFCRIFAKLHEGREEVDEGWMIGWFANAIETGRSAGLRALESRSEVLEEGYRQGYFDAAAGKKPSVSLLKSHRAEPGAPLDERMCRCCKGSGTVKGISYGHGPDDYETDVTCQNCHGIGVVLAKHEPNAAEQTGHDLAAAPSHEGHGAGPASAAPEIACTHMTCEEVNMLIDERDSAHARGREEGLEEAAKVCEQNIYGTSEFQFGSRTCAAAIRAKIKGKNG